MNEESQDLAKGMEQMQEACARLGRAMREAAEAFARAARPVMEAMAEAARQHDTASTAGRLHAHQFQGRAVQSPEVLASLLSEQAEYRAAMGIREAASAGEEYSRHNTS